MAIVQSPTLCINPASLALIMQTVLRVCYTEEPILYTSLCFFQSKSPSSTDLQFILSKGKTLFIFLSKTLDLIYKEGRIKSVVIKRNLTSSLATTVVSAIHDTRLALGRRPIMTTVCEEIIQNEDIPSGVWSMNLKSQTSPRP